MVKKLNTFSGFFVPYLASWRPATTRLVEVPISVQVPPSTVAKDMGIRSFLGLMPHLRCAEQSSVCMGSV